MSASSLPPSLRPASGRGSRTACAAVGAFLALAFLAPLPSACGRVEGGAAQAPAPAPTEAGQEQGGAPAIVIDSAGVQRALSAIGAGGPQEAVEISELELRRALVYALGATELEARKIDLYVEEEMRRQLGQGAESGSFQVTAEEVQEAVDELVRQVQEQYADLPVDAVLRHNNIDPSSLQRMTAQSKLFERVFLPEDPSNWPATTREAIRARAGEEFMTKLEESHAKRLELEAAGQPAPEAAGQAMFKMLMRQMVMQELNAASKIETASDGLPPAVVMRVNGVDIATDAIYQQIQGRISPIDRERAERWVTKSALVARALEQTGALLDDEAFRAAYAEHEQPYQNSPLSLEVIARNFKGFPSMESYRQHFRLQESYQRSIAADLTDETLTAHLGRANQLLGVGSVDVEVLLCSAFDFQNKTWLENGWENAAAEARLVAEQLAASAGEDWGALLDAHSDFWDPPAAATPAQGQAQPQRKNKGRFGTLNRNVLLQYLQESDYSQFLDGYSVGDAIFFDLEPGQIGGPWVGPHGYYFARILRRIPPSRVQSLSDANFRSMVVQDYVAVRFNAFARTLFDAAHGQGQ
jgi:hypothetical protein